MGKVVLFEESGGGAFYFEETAQQLLQIPKTAQPLSCGCSRRRYYYRDRGCGITSFNVTSPQVRTDGVGDLEELRDHSSLYAAPEAGEDQESNFEREQMPPCVARRRIY